nr:MAG TPA: hypothetical protein [Caudoviricetes sp.]
MIFCLFLAILQVSTEFLHKICYYIKKEDKLMEDIKKLELMIKNDSKYNDIIEQSMQIDKYIKKKIEGAL